MKYQVMVYKDGAYSPIDTVDANVGYTAEQYIKDCEMGADQEWCDMLRSGEVFVEAIED